MSLISDKILALSLEYLGFAAKKLLERQASQHMNGLAFESLQTEDLPEFSKWVRISAGLIIDKEKAKELAEKILALK